MEKRQRIEDIAHRNEILQQKKAARTAGGRDHLRSVVPGVDALFSNWVASGRSIRTMTNRTLKLLELYGAEMLGDAVSQALERNISAISIKIVVA